MSQPPPPPPPPSKPLKRRRSSTTSSSTLPPGLSPPFPAQSLGLTAQPHPLSADPRHIRSAAPSPPSQRNSSETQRSDPPPSPIAGVTFGPAPATATPGPFSPGFSPLEPPPWYEQPPPWYEQLPGTADAAPGPTPASNGRPVPSGSAPHPNAAFTSHTLLIYGPPSQAQAQPPPPPAAPVPVQLGASMRMGSSAARDQGARRYDLDADLLAAALEAVMPAPAWPPTLQSPSNHHRFGYSGGPHLPPREAVMGGRERRYGDMAGMIDTRGCICMQPWRRVGMTWWHCPLHELIEQQEDGEMEAGGTLPMNWNMREPPRRRRRFGGG